MRSFRGPILRGTFLRWFGWFAGLLLFVTLLPVALAIDPRLLSDRFIVQHWGHGDGLPSEAIRCLTQSRDGSLWIGTRRGLFQFDGRRFYGFDRSNVPAMIEEDVLAITEDSNGQLWVSCSRGLLRSTPSGFVRISIPSELEKPPAGYLHATATGTLWMEGGLPGMSFAVGGQTLRFHDTRTEGFLGWVDSHNRRWLIGHDWSLKRVSSSGSNESIQSIPPTPNHPEFRSAVDPTGIPWFLMGQDRAVDGLKLYRVDGTNLTCVLPQVPYNVGRPTALAFDAQGGVWMPAGAQSALARWSNQALELWNFGTNTQEVIPQSLLTDRDGSLWVGTESAGLYRITPRIATVLTTQHGLPSNAVRCVGVGGAGELLVGTDAGLAAFAIQSNSPPALAWVALTNKSLRALSAGLDGITWAGTSRGLFRLRGGIEEKMPIQTVRTRPANLDPQRLASLKIRSLAPRPDGSVWFAGIVHLSALLPEAPRSRVVAFERSDFKLSKLMPDRLGNLWFAEAKWGVGCYSSNAIAQLSREIVQQGSFGDEVLERDQTQPEFLAPPSLRLTLSNGLSSTLIADMQPDSTGGIWLATASGLNYFAPRNAASRPLGGPAESWEVPVDVEKPPFVFTRVHGLPNQSINSLVEDGFGNLWCGTDTGIFAVPMKELQSVARGSASMVHPRLFTQADGLLSLEADGQETHKGSCRLPDGRVCFATAIGTAIFDAGQLERSPGPPSTLVQEVIADGELIRADLPGITQARVEGIAISPQLATAGVEAFPSATLAWTPREPSNANQASHALPLKPGRGRTLEFRFGTREFLGTDPCRFRYRLEGLDEAGVWHDAQERRTAHFNSLPPGRYSFQVQATHPRWRNSGTPGNFEFVLEPHLWQRVWFKILAPSALAAMLFLGIQWRVREARRLAELRSQNELLRERAGIARDLHDGLGAHVAELALLSTLMPKVPPEKAATIGKRLELLGREVSMALRNTVWAATPQADNLSGLVAHMNETFARQTTAAGIRFEGDSPSDFPELELPGHFRRSLFWAAQESVTNSIKHSGCTQIQLTVRQVGSQLELQIQDNGKGFQADAVSSNAARPPRGNGLGNQERRLADIGGTVQIHSKPGSGTQTVFRVPLPRETDAIPPHAS